MKLARAVHANPRIPTRATTSLSTIIGDVATQYIRIVKFLQVRNEKAQ